MVLPVRPRTVRQNRPPRSRQSSPHPRRRLSVLSPPRRPLLRRLWLQLPWLPLRPPRLPSCPQLGCRVLPLVLRCLHPRPLHRERLPRGHPPRGHPPLRPPLPQPPRLGHRRPPLPRHVTVAATHRAPRPVQAPLALGTTRLRQARACRAVAAKAVSHGKAARHLRRLVQVITPLLPARECRVHKAVVPLLPVPAVPVPAPRARTRA